MTCYLRHHIYQLPSENLWFPPAVAGYSPANRQPFVSGAHAGLPHPPAPGPALPDHGASSLGWDRSLAASGPGTAGGTVDVRILHRPEVVDQAAPFSGKD